MNRRRDRLRASTTMTYGGRLRIAVWIVLIAIAGVAGISYLHPYNTRISWSDSRLLDVSISDGNFRIIHLSAEASGSVVRESPLEEYADHWTSDSTKTLTWYRSHQVIFREKPIRYLGLGCKLIGPLAIMSAFLLVLWGARRRRQLAGATREIIRPSDRLSVRPFRRVIRRSVVVFLGLATVLAVSTWVVSYKWPCGIYAREFDWDTLTVESYRTFDGGYTTVSRSGPVPYVYPSLVIRMIEGQVDVSYGSRITKGTIVPTRRFGLAGFLYWRRVSLPPPTGYMGGHPPWLPEEILKTTDGLTRGIAFPCWASVFLFSAWPIIAFLRGPYRRAARRAEGCCHKCGYNLTGLVEPRCPECGTTTSL